MAQGIHRTHRPPDEDPAQAGRRRAAAAQKDQEAEETPEEKQRQSKDLSVGDVLLLNNMKPNEYFRKDGQYELNSQPTGLCLIINNGHFGDGDVRHGTDKDAELTDLYYHPGFAC
ncbi:hypothetical protein F7725_006383 [Dissostichus mawsoni]|uniref:Caspase family p20 domain-containing protein n=1 Tax=Dissostichus mawsoni TaxID=36200 RepID=A0A7J5XUG0_DISMA|nr:hypothetical protein F7725_006383 [Dissostichus mawsoni]